MKSLEKLHTHKNILGIGLSIFIHGLLGFFLLKSALHYVLPAGRVSSTMEFQPIQGSLSAAPKRVRKNKIDTKVQRKKRQAKKVRAQKPKEQFEELDGTLAVAKKKPKKISKKLPKKKTPPSKAEIPEADIPVEAPLPGIAANSPIDDFEIDNNQPHQEDTDLPSGISENTDGISPENLGLPDGPVRSHKELSAVAGNPLPVYPWQARLRRIQGTTVLQFVVEPNGSVSNISVIQSSGNPYLDRAAVSAHKNWKYRPTGSRATYQKPYRFSLKGSAEQIKINK